MARLCPRVSVCFSHWLYALEPAPRSTRSKSRRMAVLAGADLHRKPRCLHASDGIHLRRPAFGNLASAARCLANGLETFVAHLSESHFGGAGIDQPLVPPGRRHEFHFTISSSIRT